MIQGMTWSQYEIANMMGVSQAYIAQIEARALAKLRKSAKAKRLAELAGYDARLEAWATTPEWQEWKVPA